jgi:hypothetical protein
MAGPDPAIHLPSTEEERWITGSSPVMTSGKAKANQIQE